MSVFFTIPMETLSSIPECRPLLNIRRSLVPLLNNIASKRSQLHSNADDWESTAFWPDLRYFRNVRHSQGIRISLEALHLMLRRWMKLTWKLFPRFFVISQGILAVCKVLNDTSSRNGNTYTHETFLGPVRRFLAYTNGIQLRRGDSRQAENVIDCSLADRHWPREGEDSKDLPVWIIDIQWSSCMFKSSRRRLAYKKRRLQESDGIWCPEWRPDHLQPIVLCLACLWKTLHWGLYTGRLLFVSALPSH